MSTDACPECAGPRLVRHPAGPLVISHSATCGLGAQEDGRKVADAERALEAVRTWTRLTTAAERILVAHVCEVSPAAVPDETTVARVVTPAVIRRSWAGLDPDAVPEEETA